MEWQDEGIVLSARPHGETDAILSALTFEHGRHLGLVKGGIGRRARPLLQPGNRLELAWKARLAEHLGHFTRRADAAVRRPAARRPAAARRPRRRRPALLDEGLAEREPHPRLYAGLLKLLGGMLADPRWPETYVRFELLLLQELGFALDLDRCAVTGPTDDLAYVSPRTGRAVSRGPPPAIWRARLLPLPPFLVADVPATFADVRAGLRLSGHFLAKQVFGPRRQALARRPRAADRAASGNRDETDRMSRAATAAAPILPIALKDALSERYLAYALSTITARSLPDVRDGLKPVQRRILYAMLAAAARPGRRLQEMRPRRRRRDRQVPPARRRRGLRRAGAPGPGLRPALPAGRRPGQFRQYRRR